MVTLDTGIVSNYPTKTKGGSVVFRSVHLRRIHLKSQELKKLLKEQKETARLGALSIHLMMHQVALQSRLQIEQDALKGKTTQKTEMLGYRLFFLKERHRAIKKQLGRIAS